MKRWKAKDRKTMYALAITIEDYEDSYLYNNNTGNPENVKFKNAKTPKEACETLATIL